jgi:hypothetical protein
MAETVNAPHIAPGGYPSVTGVIGTLGTADTKGTANTLPPAINPATGGWYTHQLTSSPLVTETYDNIAVTYPDGTTETYTFKRGTAPVGTLTLVYLDTAKGSLSTVIKS